VRSPAGSLQGSLRQGALGSGRRPRLDRRRRPTRDRGVVILLSWSPTSWGSDLFLPASGQGSRRPPGSRRAGSARASRRGRGGSDGLQARRDGPWAAASP
jgi:hypothetical protein